MHVSSLFRRLVSLSSHSTSRILVPILPDTVKHDLHLIPALARLTSPLQKHTFPLRLFAASSPAPSMHRTVRSCPAHTLATHFLNWWPYRVTCRRKGDRGPKPAVYTRASADQ
jgi:hypothetical protein